MADDPGAELNDAFRRLKRATGVPMKALAEGLLFRDDTGEAHLSRPDVARHLAELVDRAYLGDAAGRLGLGREGFAALRAFSGRVHAVVAPEYSERAPHCALGDALESAVIGDILADRQAWEPALEHLEDAWKFLGSRRLRASDRGFHEFVRAGTQIAVIRDYQGQHDHSSRVMCRVLRVISLTDTSRLPPRTQKAVASAFRSASVAYRHQGKRPPAQIIRLCNHSFTRLASFPGLDTLGVAGALRDQVRPRLQMRLGFAPSGGLEPALEWGRPGLPCRSARGAGAGGGIMGHYRSGDDLARYRSRARMPARDRRGAASVGAGRRSLRAVRATVGTGRGAAPDEAGAY